MSLKQRKRPRRQNRDDLLRKVAEMYNLSDAKKTTGYFTREQLLELIARAQAEAKREYI